MDNNILKQKVTEYFEQNIETSGSFESGAPKEAQEEHINGLLNDKNDKEMLELVRKYFDRDDIKILDLGSGLGGFVKVCEDNNLDIKGVEIDEEAAEIARFRINGPEKIITLNTQDELPWENESFDVITSRCVVEHVDKLDKYLQDAYRVLKKDGIFIIFAPNFLFPWEGHYKTFFLPWLMPKCKWLLKLFLKLKRRDTQYLKFINTKITPGFLKRKLKRAGFKKFENLSIERFLDRFENPEKINYRSMSKVLLQLKRNKILFNFIMWLLKNTLKITRLYHPLIVVTRK